jgi:hypothetical protein
LVDAAAAAAGTISPSVALAQGTASARPARAHHRRASSDHIHHESAYVG